MQYSIGKVFYDDTEDFDYLANELSKSYPNIIFVDSYQATTISDSKLLSDISAELDEVWHSMTVF